MPVLLAVCSHEFNPSLSIICQYDLLYVKVKVMSVAWPLSNQDVLRIGDTTLTLHIHPGKDTCDDCEPGLVQAKLLANAPKGMLGYKCSPLGKWQP